MALVQVVIDQVTQAKDNKAHDPDRNDNRPERMTPDHVLITEGDKSAEKAIRDTRRKLTTTVTKESSKR